MPPSIDPGAIHHGLRVRDRLKILKYLTHLMHTRIHLSKAPTEEHVLDAARGRDSPTALSDTRALRSYGLTERYAKTSRTKYRLIGGSRRGPNI